MLAAMPQMTSCRSSKELHSSRKISSTCLLIVFTFLVGSGRQFHLKMQGRARACVCVCVKRLRVFFHKEGGHDGESPTHRKKWLLTWGCSNCALMNSAESLRSGTNSTESTRPGSSLTVLMTRLVLSCLTTAFFESS